MVRSELLTSLVKPAAMLRQEQEFRHNSIHAIKHWVRNYLQLEADTLVLVAEVNCADPGCPVKQTQVAILHKNGNTRKLTIHKPLVYIRKWDIEPLICQLP